MSGPDDPVRGRRADQWPGARGPSSRRPAPRPAQPGPGSPRPAPLRPVDRPAGRPAPAPPAAGPAIGRPAADRPAPAVPPADPAFDRLGRRPAPGDPLPPPVPGDPAGRQALYSQVAAPPLLGSVALTCGRCSRRSVVSWLQAVRLGTPGVLVPVPDLGRRQLVLRAWMRCPSCHRRAWQAVTLRS